MKKISLKSQRRMLDDASRGKWYNLIQLKRVPEFAAWLTDDFHEWIGQSPDEGEILRLHKHGTTIAAYYDGRRTICGRHMMALWYCFLEFHDNVFGQDAPDREREGPDLAKKG